MVLDLQSALVLTVGILNTVLGLVVFSRDRKDLVGRSFGLMAILVSAWSYAAFLFRVVGDLELAYYLGFVLYVAAAVLPPIFLVVTLVFPPKSYLTHGWKLILILETLIVIGVTAWPGKVILEMDLVNGERVLYWGRLYILYVAHHSLWFLTGYGVMLKKFLHAEGVQRKQLLYVILATILPANLALISNLILPWMGIYTFYTWLGQVCMIFIVLFTGYAIWRHHLFNIKVIATEIFVLASSSTMLIRFFLAKDSVDRWVGGGILFAVSFFGAMLIRSVWAEVKQREELEVLSKKLENANEQLKDLDQARADFITLTSHQLRTPPATLKWYLSAIRQGDYGQMDEGVKEMVVKAEITNNSLISLIEDLLNASRIERGKMEFLFEPADLEELTRFTVEQLLPQARMKKLELSYTPPKKEVPKVLVDREKVRQVINNFIDNAIKYTLKGSISVWVEADDKNVYVKVKDTGKGVAKNIAPSLFAKYSRGKDAAIHSTGIGLGLFVAKIVIENHKGVIGVESEGEGKGSTFYFSLPIHNDLPHTKVMDLVKQKQDPEQVVGQDKGESK